MICELQRSRTSTRLLPAVSAAVLCIILMLGLWPFHAPPNDFSWLGNRNGLHFGRFSTAFSSNEFRMTPALDRTSGSLEIWLQPDRISDGQRFPDILHSRESVCASSTSWRKLDHRAIAWLQQEKNLESCLESIPPPRRWLLFVDHKTGRNVVVLCRR